MWHGCGPYHVLCWGHELHRAFAQLRPRLRVLRVTHRQQMTAQRAACASALRPSLIVRMRVLVTTAWEHGLGLGSGSMLGLGLGLGVGLACL